MIQPCCCCDLIHSLQLRTLQSRRTPQYTFCGMQETSQPSGPGQQLSALLRCLAQLNADTWAQVLLPKLVEQGSAADVALSCSQLRDLCYSSRQSLKLGALLDSTDPWSLRSQIQNLPEHFPNCSAVSLKLKSDNCCHTMPYLLPELARLPHLDGLCMAIKCILQPLLACSVLYSMRAQLPSLRVLTLTVHHPEHWVAGEDVHRGLGELTQLTSLCLRFKNIKVGSPLQYPAVSHLSNLKQLQGLAFWCDWEGTDSSDVSDRFYRYQDAPGSSPHPILPAQVLSASIGLTRLESNLFDVASLADLSSCVNLQHLAVCMPWEQLPRELDPADWAGLAALTRLTELRLLNVRMSEASPEACEALSKLTRLQVAAASQWFEFFMPALAGCVHLTELCGGWKWFDASEHGSTLPHVLELSTPSSGEGPTARFECFQPEGLEASQKQY